MLRPDISFNGPCPHSNRDRQRQLVFVLSRTLWKWYFATITIIFDEVYKWNTDWLKVPFLHGFNFFWKNNYLSGYTQFTSGGLQFKNGMSQRECGGRRMRRNSNQMCVAQSEWDVPQIGCDSVRFKWASSQSEWDLLQTEYGSVRFKWDSSQSEWVLLQIEYVTVRLKENETC